MSLYTAPALQAQEGEQGSLVACGLVMQGQQRTAGSLDRGHSQGKPCAKGAQGTGGEEGKGDWGCSVESSSYVESSF